MTTFPNNYIKEIDSRLLFEYDMPISRKEYMTFFDWFNKLVSMNDGYNECQFEYHKERSKWKMIQRLHKRRWKFTIIIDTLVSKNIMFKTTYRFGKDKPHTRTYQYTQDFLNSFKLDKSFVDIQCSDITEYKHVDNVQYDLLMSNRFKIDVSKALDYTLNEIELSEQLKVCNKINAMNNKRIYLSIGSKSGRVTTSFTNLNRDLRQFCTIDGEPLQSLDLQSSQIYLLTSIMLRTERDADTVRLFELITKGDIYEWIMDKTGLTDREYVKKETYHYIYKNSRGWKTVLQPMFEKEFPTFHSRLVKLRSKLNKEGNSLSAMLQRVERDVFIPIAEKFCNKGCLSVHDSLYFKTELRDEIRDELYMSLTKQGFSSFKIK